MTIAVAVQLDGNSTVPDGPEVGREPSSDSPPELLHDEWAQAEERYGLYRPSLGETAIVVHRQRMGRNSSSLQYATCGDPSGYRPLVQ